jgi:DNA (cytosine-5)-methyltransferase 3A
MKENKLNVLSLFDGMSCGQQALERAGFNIENYFASEIDKYAIQVTMANYPNTKQLGSVVNVDGYSLPKIDLLLGGSPCQSFSFAGKRKGMSTKDEQEILTLNHYLQLKSEDYEFEGQSYLFWEYMRLLNELRTNNPNVYFLLENVEMGEKWEKVLNKAIGVKGIHINSSLVSAQNRKRIYWTNIGLEKSGLFEDYESIIKQPKDKRLLLKNILEDEVNDKYFLSEKFDNWLKKHSLKRGNEYKKTEGNRKASCLSVSALKSVNLSADFIVHNLQKRSAGRPAIQKNKNAGGSGHLCREDGKTYCLDSGNTQAVEIRKVKQLSTNNKSNGGIQPYQQDRIYDINGISPALQSQLCTGSTMLNTSKIRRLTPIECERLQTVKDNYTNYVSDSQRYKMLGNGWTIDVIAHILKYIK